MHNELSRISTYAGTKGFAPKDLANNSAFRDLVRCDGRCTLPISDYSIIKGLDETSIRDGVAKVVRLIDLSDIPNLVQLLIDMDLEPGIVAVDENVSIDIKGELGGLGLMRPLV